MRIDDPLEMVNADDSKPWVYSPGRCGAAEDRCEFPALVGRKGNPVILEKLQDHFARRSGIRHRHDSGDGIGLDEVGSVQLHAFDKELCDDRTVEKKKALEGDLQH